MGNRIDAIARRIPIVKFTRSLRFRLTVSYLLFFTLLLVMIGLLIRQSLIAIQDTQLRELVDEDWLALKGYMDIEHQDPVWLYDHNDPDESYIVSRLQHVFLMIDSNGIVVRRSETYQSIGIDPPADVQAVLKSMEPVYRIRRDEQGWPYMVRSGVILDDHKNKYYVAIGRLIGPFRDTVNTFTRKYFTFLPVLVAITGLFGWLLAKRALEPVNSVARAAQQITSSSLDLRIATRGAGDELDRLVETFNEMMQRLHQSFERIRQFSTDVSHELRTPLTGIRGQLEVALFTAETADQYREAMVNALQDVEQLSNIVRALLMLSQAESGQLVLQMNPLDLGQVVEDVVDQFQIPAEAEGVSLSAPPPQRCYIRGDRTQIERLLSNLLSNAVKYTPSGGSVQVRLDSLNGSVQLTVEDTGVGIPADQLPHIFDRFYRVRSAQTTSRQGLGLGLSFVAWIVNAHGAKIDVQSEVGKGSRFTVSFPSLESPSPALPPVAVGTESR